MKKSILTYALGTTALGLTLSGFYAPPEENLQDVPVQVSPYKQDQLDNRGIESVEDILNNMPKVNPDRAYFRPQRGFGFEDEDDDDDYDDPDLKPVDYVKISSLYGAGYYYIPGTDTALKIGGYVRTDTPIVTYDSNVCQYYNSGTFAYPDPWNYDPRFLDEAAWYVDQLSDDEFEDYVDWLDGYGPRPWAKPGTALWNAIEIVYWMRDDEYDDFEDWVFEEDHNYHVEKRIEAFFSGQNPAQGFIGNGLKDPVIRARAYIQFDPRGMERFKGEFQGIEFADPQIQIATKITETQAQKLGQAIEKSGGGTVENSDGGLDIAVPYNMVYNLDRFKIYTDYRYGLENNITDGSVPTLQYEGGENPFNNYLNRLIEDPKAVKWTVNPGMLKFSLDYANYDNYDFGDGGAPATQTPATKTPPAQKTTENSEWDDLGLSVGIKYDLGNGLSLRVPFGKYTYDQETAETPQQAPTGEYTAGNYYSGIQFKIEESVVEGDQTNLRPAQETVVKLNFAPPPMPLDGNTKIDDGAQDDPIQGELDSQTGRIKFDYKWGSGLSLSAGLSYKVDDEDENAGDTTGEDEKFQVSGGLYRIKIGWDDGGMVQIDPPSLDLSAGPEPVESVMNDLQPYTGPDQVKIPKTVMDDIEEDLKLNSNTGDTSAQTTQPNRSVMEDIEEDRRLNNMDPGQNLDLTGSLGLPTRPSAGGINWGDVQNALGEYADPNRLNQMITESTETNRTNTNTNQGLSQTDYQNNLIRTTPGEFGSTRLAGTTVPEEDRVRYYTPNISGFQYGVDYTPQPQVDIEKTPVNSENVYSTDPDYTLGGLNQYLRRSFDIDGVRVDSLFFPADQQEIIKSTLDNNPTVDGHDKNPYRDKQGNDPYFQSSGSWGQNYPDQWAIQHVGFTNDQNSAWASAGDNLSPIIVAVIDTGIDWNHADFAWDRIWRNQDEIPENGIDDDNNGYVDDVVGWNFYVNNNLPWDDDGHGTFVAGIISAENDNKIGISGINPASTVMVLKALDAFGHTRANYLAEAIVYAVDNGAQVINLSVGGDELSHAEELAVNYAEKKGVLVFAAAGNKAKDGKDFGFVPYDSVVVVGSTNREDAKSGFSNWGEGIDITAPGEDVLSLRARRTDLMLNIRHLNYDLGTNYVGDDKRYYRAAGTSFSTPIVAGVASLIWSKNPKLSAADVRRMVLQTARDIGAPGRDQQTGFGLVDAVAALNADPKFEIVADISGVEVVQDGSNLLVAVLGSASADQFANAQIFIGKGEDPSDWKAVVGGLKKPVSGGTLGRIPAGEFQGAPVWIIRLVVTHKDGKTREERFTLTLG